MTVIAKVILAVYVRDNVFHFTASVCVGLSFTRSNYVILSHKHVRLYIYIYLHTMYM